MTSVTLSRFADEFYSTAPAEAYRTMGESGEATPFSFHFVRPPAQKHTAPMREVDWCTLGLGRIRLEVLTADDFHRLSAMDAEALEGRRP